MTHHATRPIPAKRIYTMSRFNFTEDQWDMLQDGINEERNARAAVLACPVCNNSGHNCPECADWESDEGEDGHPVCDQFHTVPR